MSRCPHGVFRASECPECAPAAPSGDLGRLRHQYLEVTALLALERKRVARLERQLEYEAFVANREFEACYERELAKVKQERGR